MSDLVLPSLWVPERRIRKPSFNFIRNLMSPMPGRMISGGKTVTFEGLLLSYEPQAWWKLNEANGSSTVADSSGNGWTGTCAGVTLGATGPGIVPGATACHFSSGPTSTGIGIQMSGPLAPFQDHDFSVIAMVSDVNTGATQNPAIFSVGKNETTDECMAWSVVPPDWAIGQWFDDWTSSIAEDTSGAWHFMSYTYHAATKTGTMYKDGTGAVSHTFTGVLNVPNGYYVNVGNGLGADPWLTWIGTLAEVAVYNFQLSSGQLSALNALV